MKPERIQEPRTDHSDSRSNPGRLQHQTTLPEPPPDATPPSPEISLADVADLIYAAEDLNPRLGLIEARVLSRNPETAYLYQKLERQARDSGIAVGSPHWSLATVDLNDQLDCLLGANDRERRQPEEILGLDAPIVVDLGSLITLCEARLGRHQPYAERLGSLLTWLRIKLAERGEGA